MLSPTINALLAGARAGHYALPAAVEAAADRVAEIAGAIGPAKRRVSELEQEPLRRRHQVATEYAASTADPATADTSTILAARREHEEAVELLRLLDAMRERAEARAVQTVRREADAIRTSLRSALTDLLEAFRPDAAAAAALPWHDGGAILRSKDGNRLYNVAVAAGDRYEAIRAAERAIPLGKDQLDRSGMFAESPMGARSNVISRTGHPGARLAELLASGVELWVPTLEERNAAARAHEASQVAA